jgi:hypothetical protein
MDRDILRAVEDHKKDLLKDELDKFMESSIGRPQKRDNWVQLRR